MWWPVIAAWIYTLICVVVVYKRWEKVAMMRVIPISWVGPAIITIGIALMEWGFPVREEIQSVYCWTISIIIAKGVVISAWLIWAFGLRGIALWMAPFFPTAQQLALSVQWRYWWLWILVIFVGHIGLAIWAIISLKA
jgi:hypothetical protein